MITLTERERAIREWKEEADYIIDQTCQKEITASHIQNSIMYLGIHQHKLNQSDITKIIGLDYAKEVLRAHLNEVRTNITALEEKYAELKDGPVMGGEGKGDE